MDSNTVMTRTLTTTDVTATVTNLNPLSPYTCDVTASTSVGTGPAASLNFTTATAGTKPKNLLITPCIVKCFVFIVAPEDAPFGVQVEGNSPSSVLVSWNAPLTPNGAITSYTLYINYTDMSPAAVIRSNSELTSYTVTDLQPYQMVSVRVSASTVAGEGPASDSATGRARELGMTSSN